MRKIVFVIGLVLLCLLTIVRAFDPGPTRALRDAYFDTLQRIFPRQDADLPIRIVDIDEASLLRLGQWPWPRDLLAELVDRIAGYGAAVVVFDVLFPEPDRMSPSSLAGRLKDSGLLVPGVTALDLSALDNDLRFAQSIAMTSVILGTAQSSDQTAPGLSPKAGFVEIGAAPSEGLLPLEATVPVLPPLLAAAAGVGVVNVSPFDAANVVRRVPLMWRGSAGVLPSLAVEALRVATGGTTFVLVGAPDLTGFAQALRLDDAEIPLTPDGQMWVRYRPDTRKMYLPAWTVLAETPDPAVAARLAGNIVFIGTSAAGLLDIRTTALGENVPGVSIHAQVLEQILLGDYLRRDGLVEALEVIVFLALGLAVTGVMAAAGPVASITAGLAAALVVTGGSWLAFRDYGVLFDATYPLIGGFLAFAGLLAFQFVVSDRDKRMIRRSFSHYVAPSVLSVIERGGHKLQLGGVAQPVTVMFSDIRGFTALSETLTATELVDLLNRLFTDLGAEILREQGTIDKFIGDAIMAFWNAPLEMNDHPARAATAALAMRSALRRFNAEGRAPVPVAMALGLATGQVCVGNIGSRDRFNYTVVGETVNQAARIEAGCRIVDYDILVSRQVALAAPGLAFLEAGTLDLKGVSERIATCILVGGPEVAQSRAFADLRDAQARVIQALKCGTDPAESAFACHALAGGIDPGLTAFVDRMLLRSADFR